MLFIPRNTKYSLFLYLAYNTCILLTDTQFNFLRCVQRVPYLVQNSIINSMCSSLDIDRP